MYIKAIIIPLFSLFLFFSCEYGYLSAEDAVNERFLCYELDNSGSELSDSQDDKGLGILESGKNGLVVEVCPEEAGVASKEERHAFWKSQTKIVEQPEVIAQEAEGFVMSQTSSDDLLYLTGHYPYHCYIGVVGKGEVSDKVRVTFINGILNQEAEMQEATELLSLLHGNVNIHYIYRTTSGLSGDFLRVVLVKYFGGISPEAQQLATIWRQMIAEMGGVESGGVIMHYLHSLGGAETEIAGYLLTAEERAMIRVIAFGSSTVLPKDEFSQVMHYVSWRDAIFFADPVRYLQSLWSEKSNVTFVSGAFGIPFVDHTFCYSYRPVLEALGHHFTATYGLVE